MTECITPEQLPHWVPGEITAASDSLGWRNVMLRGYRYLGQDVRIPPVRDYMVVSYKRGVTPMERRFEGRWSHARCAPGSISLLTCGQRSQWNWSRNVEVRHIYLTESLLTRLATEAHGHEVEELRLLDVLDVDDPIITRAVDALWDETRQKALGGSLYAEAVAAQLGLHLIRHYSSVALRERAENGGLTAVQQRRVTEYLEAHLHAPLQLEDLAAAAGLGVSSFNRRFRASFDRPPWAWVIERRMARARALIEAGQMPLKQVAPACGFNDQAHMTRLFRSRLGITPGELRRQAQR